MMRPLPKFETKRLPKASKAKPAGCTNPALAKTEATALAVNRPIVLAPRFASKRLPELSKAKPSGWFIPEAKTVAAPAEEIVEMVPLPALAT